MKAKVFCIGFHKTGTSSMTVALRELGYRVTGPNGVHDPDIAENLWSIIEQAVTEYDAFQDNPWPIVFKELDARYPGSKFVLTERDADGWVRSQVKHFGTRTTPMRKMIYGADAGAPEGNESIYLERYRQHGQEVREYFKDRPDDLLIMDLTAGDGWQALCGFLGHQVPAKPFPRANTAESRRAEPILKRIRRRLVRWFGRGDR
ncbi:MAG: sulfotransferase family protein [Pseudomonadota bacterium]